MKRLKNFVIRLIKLKYLKFLKSKKRLCPVENLYEEIGVEGAFDIYIILYIKS